MWDNNRRFNIYIVQVPQERKKSGAEKVFEEVMA